MKRYNLHNIKEENYIDFKNNLRIAPSGTQFSIFSNCEDEFLFKLFCDDEETSPRFLTLRVEAIQSLFKRKLFHVIELNPAEAQLKNPDWNIRRYAALLLYKIDFLDIALYLIEKDPDWKVSTFIKYLRTRQCTLDQKH